MLIASISETLVNETSHFVRDAGLPGIFVLMAVSSACIPIPSEVVMLFAGFAVADRLSSHAHHHLTLLGIVLAGLLGTMVGSWVAYAVGRGGRLELFERHGSKLHMGPEQIDRADRWFQRYGAALGARPRADRGSGGRRMGNGAQRFRVRRLRDRRPDRDCGRRPDRTAPPRAGETGGRHLRLIRRAHPPDHSSV